MCEVFLIKQIFLEYHNTAFILSDDKAVNFENMKTVYINYSFIYN
jgi:hypothetical protein